MKVTKFFIIGLIAAGYISAFSDTAPLLLEYLFNETGSKAVNSGTLDAPLELRSMKGNQLVDLHSGEGLGVSGKSGDRAFDNMSAEMGGGGNVACTAGNVDEINGLVSFTFCGWYKTKDDASFINSMARLATKYSQPAGWQILGHKDNSGLMFYVNGGNRTVTFSSSSLLAQTKTWVFLAITYDGTKSKDNYKIYAGDRNNEVKLLSTQTLDSKAVAENTAALTIGNELNRTRAFAGYIDNIRLYGTKTAGDASGVLSLSQLETVRAGYLSDGDQLNTPEPVGAVYDEVTKMYTDTRFPEYLFPYRPILILNCYDAGYTFMREPILRRMPDGSLFCLHYTGGESEPNDANVMIGTSSTDEGETWSPARVLFQHPERGVYAPELFVEDGLPTVVLHTFQAVSRHHEERVYVSKSADSGKTWSEPVSLPGVALAALVRTGIVLADGTQLFPHYWTEMDEDCNWDWTERNVNYYNRPSMRNWIERCGVIRSTDHGESYSHHGYIRAENTKIRLLEPAVVELEPNHVLMLMRADGRNGFYKSESFDGGKTWSVAELSDIDAIASKVQLIKHNGAVVMLFNARPDTTAGDGLNTRQRLSAWVSFDNCKTWTKKIDLAYVKPGTPEKWKAVCYPDAFIDAGKGLLYCSIDNYRQAFLIKVPLSDLGL